MTKQELLDKANDLPLAPGVYLMMDKTGCVIYVGKAKKLKNRVSQYFQENSSHNEKTRRMVSQVDHFDTIFVSTEFEALILENSLIKQHMPRYNILLKDDKGYPFVRLGTEHYPRFTMASKPADDNALYFGPFGGRNETRAAIDAICAAFRLPTCSRKFPRDIGKERPCLNFHMGLCDGYCRKEMPRSQRSAGILLSVTSLPSPYGIGTIGKEAREFADFLKKAGQKVWQILPVGPTSYGDSPYQSFSTYAGNPYLIDLDTLCEEGLITKEQLDSYDWGSNDAEVDYEKIYNNRFDALRIAYDNFKKKDQKAFSSFKRKNSKWLKNYALYMAVKKSFNMVSWTEWPDEEIRMHEEAAVKRYERKLKDDVDFWKFLQFKFYEQWEAFRAYVNGLGIKILGDMPIYVAMDSADTWANPELFQLYDDGDPIAVAGCPPDYFSATGQLWGNPLYDWDYLAETDYEWWFERIKAASKLYDLTRIDHFRAFASYYSIPYPAENAINGEWVEGPRIKFFKMMEEAIGKIDIVAEDLGTLTPDVTELMEQTGYPGMKVLEFAFDSGEENDYLPHKYTENCIVYTGTHDNDTVMGWVETAKPEDVSYARSYCQMPEDEPFNWGLIRTAYQSKAGMAIIPVQDILGLGKEARMNIPSTLGGNWTWRVDKAALTDELAEKLKTMSVNSGRLED